MTEEEKEDIKSEKEEVKVAVKEEKSTNKPTKDNSKGIIIALVSVIVVLVIILLVVLLGGNKKEKDEKDETESQTEEKEDINDKDIGITHFKSSDAKLYFNKYIVDNEKGKITDLDGKLITNFNNSWGIHEGVNNSLVLISSEDDKTSIKRVFDDKVYDYQYDGITDMIIDTKTGRIIGFFVENNHPEVVYLFNDKELETVELKDRVLYSFALGAGENKKVYDGRYVVTATSQSENSYRGLYDIKDKKVLIDNIYNEIEHLYDDKFVAVKNNSSGVIDKNNKVLLDFKYDSIDYSNGLYFVGKGTTLEVLDSNFNSLNLKLDIPKLKNYSYNLCCGDINPYKLIKYKDYVIIGVKEEPYYDSENYKYSVIDKNGNITELVNGYATVAKDYIVTSNDNDNKIVVYDDKLNSKYVLTANNKGTKLYDASIFLDRVLSIEGTKFFNFPDGKEKESVSPIRRTSQGYEVKLEFKKGFGTLTVIKDDEILETIDNVSVSAFLAAENNGITVTKTHFIYNAGGTLIILKK